MEMVVGVEGSEEAIFVDNAPDEFGSCSVPLKQVTDPVVYKLVRVSVHWNICLFLFCTPPALFG